MTGICDGKSFCRPKLAIDAISRVVNRLLLGPFDIEFPLNCSDGFKEEIVEQVLTNKFQRDSGWFETSFLFLCLSKLRGTDIS